MAHIAHPVTGSGLVDAFVEASFRAGQELVDLRRGGSHNDGDGAVPHKAVECGSAVDTHDVTVLEYPLAWDPVNDFMVNRYTESRWKDVGTDLVPLKGGHGAGLANTCLSALVQCDGSHAGLDRIQNLFMDVSNHLACQAHQLDLSSGLAYNHEFLRSVARPLVWSKVLAPRVLHRHGGGVSLLSPRSRLRLHYVILFLFIGASGNFLPIWFRHQGWTDTEIGWQGAISFSCLCVFPLLWGHLTDRWGRPTKVLRMLSVGCTVAFVPFLLTGDVVWLLVSTFGFFVFRTGMLTATDGMTLNFLAREGGDYGRIRLWGSFGFIVGGFILGALITELGRDVIPYILEIILGLCVVVAFMLAPVRLNEKREESVFPALWRLLKRPHLRAFYTVAFASRVSSQGLYIFLPLHLMNLGVEDVWIPLYWTVGVGSEIVLLRYAETLFGSRRRRNILILCFLLATIQHVLTALIVDVSWLLPVMLLHGFSFGIWFYTSVTWLGDAVDEQDRARAQGLFHTLGFGFGGVISSLGAGALFTLGEGPLLFMVAAGLNLGTAVLAFFLVGSPRGSASCEN
jgi:PPP family 3-phenylpropionic acid transporter